MKKILIIEDDSVMSGTLAANLESEGFEALQAKDGEEGLAMALRAKPDLILLDILLPKMDGLTVLTKLRNDPSGKNIPVIVLSNLSEPWDVAATALAGGVYQYLVKVDWTIAEVIQKIRERLGP